jgi:hypothetical protein
VKPFHSHPTGKTWQGKKLGWRKDPYHLPLSRGVSQKPARTEMIVLKQLLNFIPRSVLNQTARKTGVDTKARTFSVLSHLASMLFARLSQAISLNDVCTPLTTLAQRSFSRQQGAFG